MNTKNNTYMSKLLDYSYFTSLNDTDKLNVLYELIRIILQKDNTSPWETYTNIEYRQCQQ